MVGCLMEGNGHGPIWSRPAILLFAWRVWRKLCTTSLLIVSVLSEILIDHLLNTRRKCYSLSQLVHISQDIYISKFPNHGHCVIRSPELRQILLSSKTCLPSSYCYITCHFSKFAHIYTEDEDNVFLQNIGTRLPHWMVPCLWEPQFIPLRNTQNWLFTGICTHSHKTFAL